MTEMNMKYFRCFVLVWFRDRLFKSRWSSGDFTQCPGFKYQQYTHASQIAISISGLFPELLIQISNFKFDIYTGLSISTSNLTWLIRNSFFPLQNPFVPTLLCHPSSAHVIIMYSTKTKKFPLTLLSLFLPTSNWSSPVGLSPKSILNPSISLYLHWNHPCPGNHLLMSITSQQGEQPPFLPLCPQQPEGTL